MHWLFAHRDFLVPVAIFGLAMWQRYVRGQRESAANQEMRASGELYSPLYWLGVALPFLAIGIVVYVAKGNPAHVGVWCLLAAGLLGATLLVRRALRYRFPHPG
jgi:hypothetical protein